MFKAETLPPYSLQAKTVAIKILTLLLLLMMAPGLGAESVAFLNLAAAASDRREALGARPVNEQGSEYQINALDEKNHSKEKKSLLAGPINEVEAKRLKLIFLLMMSLGQYRTPAH